MSDRKALLEHITKAPSLRVIMDGDFGNEIDDQFALVHLARSPRVELIGVSAAPFGRTDALFESQTYVSDLDRRMFERQLARLGLTLDDIPRLSPSSGQTMSQRVANVWLSLLQSELSVLPGATDYFTADGPSPEAASSIAALVNDNESPTVLVATGALTNVAYLIRDYPELLDRLIIIWTAAYPLTWPDRNASYNLAQDEAAVRFVLARHPAMVYVPGYQVGAAMRTVRFEIDELFDAEDVLSTELRALIQNHRLDGDYRGRSKIIWDMAASAVVTTPEFVEFRERNMPLLDDDGRWLPLQSSRPMLEVSQLDRDAIFRAFDDSMP